VLIFGEHTKKVNSINCISFTLLEWPFRISFLVILVLHFTSKNI
jgi:hypothetical protein